MKKFGRWNIGIVGVMMELIFLGSPVFGGRRIPKPLLESFANGYGVVAVSVVGSAPTSEQYIFNIQCKVEKLVAQPAIGAELHVKEGDEITVPLSFGYAAQVEGLPIKVLPAGAKLYLILKYDPEAKTYAQVGGASSVRQVDNFDPATMQSIAAIRDLAAVPIADRFALARADMAAPKSNLELRDMARRVLIHVVDAGTPDTERTQTITFLRKAWDGITITQGLGSSLDAYVDISDLDRTLGAVDPDFKPDSDVRIDGWLKVTFAPFDPPDAKDSGILLKALIDRSNYYQRELAELGLLRPDRIVPKIIEGMNDAGWPLEFRVGLASALQSMYQRSSETHADWAAPLQGFYASAFATADPWVLRLLCGQIASGQDAAPFGIKRNFIADQQVYDALANARKRMDELSKTAPDGDSMGVSKEIQGALDGKSN